MFKKIKEPIEHFLGTLTIRKKLVFFAVLFFLFAPYPAYITIKTLYYQIARAEAQLEGNRFQNHLAALLRNTTRLQVMSWSKKQVQDIGNTKRSFVKQRISQILRKMIHEVETFKVAPLSPIGKGYSILQPTPPRVTPLLRYWKELELLADKEPHSEQTLFAYRRMNNAVKQEMIKVGYSSSLFLPTTEINYHLGNLSLRLLPESQQLTVELFQRAMRLEYGLGVKERVLEDIDETISLLSTVLKQIEITLTRIIHLAQTTEETVISPETILNAEDALKKYKESVKAFQTTILTDFEMNELQTIALNVVESIKNMANFSTDITEDVISRKLNNSKKSLKIFYTFLIISTIIVVILVIFRAISKHLAFIVEQLEQHAKGNFTVVRFSGFKDDMGLTTDALKQVAAMLNDILGRLALLNEHLSTASVTISQTLDSQSKNVYRQIEGIKEIGLISRKIATNSKNLSDEMDKLRISADNLSLEAQARDGLDQMKTQMVTLNDNSFEIIEKLNVIQDKVQTTMGLVSFMGKVGDKAQLLSLNAAIEASGEKAHQRTFFETVEKIQRFATNSTTATRYIQSNIEQMSHSAKETLEEIENYVNQTKSGSRGLHTVRDHFDIISSQIEKQWDEFTNINHMMKVQSTEATTLIKILDELEKSTDENAHSLKEIQELLESLGAASMQMEKVLNEFEFTRKA